MTLINAKATPINDNDYNCHIIAIELVQPIVWNPYHTTNNSLGGGYTNINTHTHTDDPYRINFKKPGVPACDRHAPGLIIEVDLRQKHFMSMSIT